jgi:hypothetical protein
MLGRLFASITLTFCARKVFSVRLPDFSPRPRDVVSLTILRAMLAAYLAMVVFGVFVVGSAHQLPGASGDLARLLIVALGLLVALGPFVVASYLVLNGITMARRESIRPGNLLSLLAGIGLFALVGLMVIAIRQSQYTALDEFTVITVLLSGYVSFLLVSYVSYAFVYGRITALRGADFIVVLGSGLIGGDRVPPLLASRLEVGRHLHQALAARRKATPMLIVSGGRGADERVSEAEAEVTGVNSRYMRVSVVDRATPESPPAVRHKFNRPNGRDPLPALPAHRPKEARCAL